MEETYRMKIENLSNTPSTETLVYDVVNACAEAKGKDIVVLEVSKVFGIASHFIIVTGRSDRQTQGICNKVIDALASQGIEPISVDGMETGHWVLADFGDIIVHVFYEPTREYYDLEGLWANADRVPLPPEFEKQAA